MTRATLTLYYLLFTTYSLLLTLYYLLFTTYSLLLTLSYLRFTTYSLLLTLYYLLFTTHTHTARQRGHPWRGQHQTRSAHTPRRPCPAHAVFLAHRRACGLCSALRENTFYSERTPFTVREHLLQWEKINSILQENTFCRERTRSAGREHVDEKQRSCVRGLK